jgi:nicotinamidase-related amidase
MDQKSSKFLSFFKSKQKQKKKVVQERFEVKTFEMLERRIKKDLNKHANINIVKKESKVENSKQGWLVVIDVDETVLKGIKRFYQAKKHLTKEYKSKRKSPQSENVYRKQLSYVIKTNRVEPIGQIAKLIKEMQSKGMPVIGVTDTFVGKMGVLENVPEYRIYQLSCVGVDFTAPFIRKFTKYPVTKAFDANSGSNETFLFSKGVIFTNGMKKSHLVDFDDEDNECVLSGKGYALHCVLNDIEKKTKWKCTGVVCIDNLGLNVNSIQDMAKCRGISFLGYVYTEHNKDCDYARRNDSKTPESLKCSPREKKDIREYLSSIDRLSRACSPPTNFPFGDSYVVDDDEEKCDELNVDELVKDPEEFLKFVSISAEAGTSPKKYEIEDN